LINFLAPLNTAIDRFCPSIDLNQRVALDIPAATQHGHVQFYSPNDQKCAPADEQASIGRQSTSIRATGFVFCAIADPRQQRRISLWPSGGTISIAVRTR